MNTDSIREVQGKAHVANYGSAERQSNGSDSPIINDQRANEGYFGLSHIESKEEFSQLSLIPLHPACKNPTPKPLPIVLGRTNFAAWWWKSCPCQHYCRLHCRPVAQNIRSLSKVMIQIDTSGNFHIVGKNPHLIAITPERSDNRLRENDIINVGRRDREPWMRFQAVRRPLGTHMGQIAVTRPTTPVTRLEAANTRRSTSNPKSLDASKASAPIRSNPPEWITTNTRKRKSGDSSSNSLSSLSKVAQAPVVNVSLHSTSAQEGASANAISLLHKAGVKAGHQGTKPETSVESTRKRRRRSTLRDETTEQEAKQRRSSRARRNSNEVDLFDRAMGGYKMTTNGDNRGRDHPQVHLIFQDYQTSASLMQGNEIRRKSESSINQATSKASRAESVVRYQQHGLGAPSRAFIADTSQLRLLSRNFAQALLGAVSPPKREELTSRGQVQSAATAREIESSEKSSPNEAENVNLASRRGISMPTSDESKQPSRTTTSKETTPACGIGSSSHGDDYRTVNKGETSSIPSVANSAFSSLEAVQTIKFATGDEVINVLDHEDSPSSLRARSNPILDLKPWQDMMELEQANGSVASFRYALASLVLAKNSDRLNCPGRRTPSWLPPLIGEDFIIERPEDKC